MSRLQSVRYVILPHIMHTIYPPLASFFIWVLLGTSMAAVIGVEELTGRAVNVSTSTLAQHRGLHGRGGDLRGAHPDRQRRALSRRQVLLPRQDAGHLMDALLSQIPQLLQLLQCRAFCCGASAPTLLLTAIGCGAGFVLGSIIALVRTAKAVWLLPLKSVFIAYVEFFRRIPFLVILFIVLFAAQAVEPDDLALRHRRDQRLPALDGLSLRDHPRRTRVRASGRRSRPPTVDELLARRTIRYVILPQAWKVILPPATFASSSCSSRIRRSSRRSASSS